MEGTSRKVNRVITVHPEVNMRAPQCRGIHPVVKYFIKNIKCQPNGGTRGMVRGFLDSFSFISIGI